MKTLSLWQPWASLLAHGLKRVDTRSWPYRGPLPQVLAIHAAKQWDSELSAICRREPFAAALEECGCRVPDPGLPLGCVVGLVRLAACVGTAEFAHGLTPSVLLTDRERAFGDYAPGRYAWVCDRFLALAEPVGARGKQGLWEWEPPLSVWARQELGEWLGDGNGKERSGERKTPPAD